MMKPISCAADTLVAAFDLDVGEDPMWQSKLISQECLAVRFASPGI